MPAHPELPGHLLELANASYGSRSDFNRRVFVIAQWLCGHGWDEHDAGDWALANVEFGGTKGHEALVRHSVQRAYEKYDPTKAGGSAPGPEFAQGLTALVELVEKSDIRDKRYWLAMLQHAINLGRNPVSASSRQIAALAGGHWTKAAEAMSRMEASKGGGLLSSVTYDGEVRHSRLWEFNTGWDGTCPPAPKRGRPSKTAARNTGTYVQACIYVPLFSQWLEEVPVGAEFTLKTVSQRLNISRYRAKQLLQARTTVDGPGDLYLVEHDRRKRGSEDTWVKQETWEVRQRQAAERVAARKRRNEASAPGPTEEVAVEAPAAEVDPWGYDPRADLAKSTWTYVPAWEEAGPTPWPLSDPV
jgi:hypothetical protein